MAPHVKQSFRDYEETKLALLLAISPFPFASSKFECIGVKVQKKITQKFDKFLPNNLKFGQINKIKGLFYNIINYM